MCIRDSNLDIDFDRVDLIIGEVKEGRAELNSSARDPKVLRAALNRFGAVPEEQIAPVIDQLLEDGEAEHPEGARVRLMSFGSVSYTHLRAHETVLDLVCRLLLEK